MMRVERLFIIAGCFFSLTLFSGKVLANIALYPQAKADLVAMGYPNAKVQGFGGAGCSCSDRPNSLCEQLLNKSLAEFTAPVGAIFNIYWWHYDTLTSSGGVCGEKGWSAIGCYVSWQCGSQVLQEEPELVITAPVNNQSDAVTQESNFISRESIFSTNAVPAPIVDWSVELFYQTSGERGTSIETISFISGAGVPVAQLFASKGGRGTARASAYVNGSLQEATVTFYLTGESIPDDVITARLLALYTDGATPRLLTGIAQVESTYRQFAARTLFEVAGRWPTESYDGGSHIGLMQMPTTLRNAWDWLENTQSAAWLFQDKLAMARRIERRIREHQPNLRALTRQELENMALVLYGPHARAGLTNQYYRAVLTRGGSDWEVNTANNAGGVAYANRVRASMR